MFFCGWLEGDVTVKLLLLFLSKNDITTPLKIISQFLVLKINYQEVMLSMSILRRIFSKMIILNIYVFFHGVSNEFIFMFLA